MNLALEARGPGKGWPTVLLCAGLTTSTIGAALVPKVAWAGPDTGSASESTAEAVASSPSEHRIPVFARQYRTSCSTCHTLAPKLNVLGEAFRINGYSMPDSDLLVREDRPVPLGSEYWKEQWPRAIPPGEIPGQTPLAIRIQSDAQITNDPGATASSTFRFPNEVYLLAGTSLGDGIGTFLETEWSEEEGVEVVQAKIAFQDPLHWLPKRFLNVWLGKQNPYLFTFTDRQIDRAARQKFSWQSFRASDLSIGEGERELSSENRFSLGDTQPAIEVNGLITPRLYYGLGVGQGSVRGATDADNHKDLYYKVRYKLGGLNLRGRYDPGGGPVTGTGGQLLDRSVIVEHFAYFGSEAGPSGLRDAHRSFGVALRALNGPLDVGVGYVWRRHDAPWGPDDPGSLDVSSVMAKAEYLFFPWLSGSLKYDYLDAVPRDRPLDSPRGALTRSRFMPGAVMLIRQNIRAVVEGELFLHDAPGAIRGESRPHNLWFRLDVTF